MWMPLHRLPHPSSQRKRKQREAPSPHPSHLASKPKTAKIDAMNVELNGLEIGHSSIQGWRPSMEDAYIIESLDSAPGHTLVAILDGHAGFGAATIGSNIFCDLLEATAQWRNYTSGGALSPADSANAAAAKLKLLNSAMVQAFTDLDTCLRESEQMDTSGCTLVVALIAPTHVLCASVGDSRCVVGTSSQCVSMSEDHKPDNAEEKMRIVAAGGFVMIGRVNGELAMSRAIGDFQYKDPDLSPATQMVSSVPDIGIHPRGAGDQVLILACDGVWDVMENEEAVAFVSDIVMGHTKPGAKKGTWTGVENGAGAENGSEKARRVTCQETASALVDLALKLGSTDNISAVVVRLPAPLASDTPGVAKGPGGRKI